MLVIIKRGHVMLVTRQNPNGGPHLKGYPVAKDLDTDRMGYQLGYCPHGDKIVMPFSEVSRVVNEFSWTVEKYEGFWSKLVPKTSLKHRLIKWMGGTINKD